MVGARVLHVDLAAGSTRTEEHDDNFLRRYGGGRGVGLYYLGRDLAGRRAEMARRRVATAAAPGGPDVPAPPRASDVFGPDGARRVALDGPLVLAAGLLTGCGFPGTPRFSIVARSPLTGLYGESEAGGYFGPELRRAGYEAVVISGRASAPCYLFIKDGTAELRPADHLWGLVTMDAQAALRRETGDPRLRVALIGPAGERGVRFGAVLNELRHANGRTGMGTVFGARNLKAVAVRGTRPVPVQDPEGLKTLATAFRHELQAGVYGQYFGQHGTPSGVSVMNATRALPTRNFRQSSFKPASGPLSGETYTREHLKKRGACEGCPLACKRVVHQGRPPYAVDPDYGGPEYETVASFGPLVGIESLPPVFKAHEICNAYGLDTISAGGVIAFAIEAVERGLLHPEKDLGVRSLTWGDADAVLDLLGQIARQEGPAAFLGQGVREVARRLGPEAETFALHVKGQEVPMHDPRSKWALGLGYAVSPTGADHCLSPHDQMLAAKGGMLKTLNPLGLLDPVPAAGLQPAKVRAFTYTHITYSLYNCLPLCNVFAPPTTGLDLTRLTRVVAAVAGPGISSWELMKIGERAATMARHYNTALGATADDDRLPARLLAQAEPPEPGGAAPPGAVSAEELAQGLALFYAQMGWDGKGRPTPAKLHELDLGWLAKEEGAG